MKVLRLSQVLFLFRLFLQFLFNVIKKYMMHISIHDIYDYVRYKNIYEKIYYVMCNTYLISNI